MEHRGSVLLSSDIFSKVPGAVLSIYGYTKKLKIKTKNTGRRAEREGEKGKGSEGDLQAHLQDK